jgi:hypothetical protein
VTTPQIFFSDYYSVPRKNLEKYGAFDINLLADVRLFVDPFLLFNSSKAEYQLLHEEIVDYLKYLKTISRDDLDAGTVKDLFRFQEVSQNWFGYCEIGNKGHGLGEDFAKALNSALGRIIKNFGEETGTRGSHLEKVSLIRPKVGKDNISDFTTNLIKHYLVDYTEKFAKKYLDKSQCANIGVNRVRFNLKTQSWVDEVRYLPVFNDDYVLLTPVDMLVHDETWINYEDMLQRYPEIVASVEDDTARSKISRYFEQRLGENPTAATTKTAKQETIATFPELLDLYIKIKEDDGEGAEAVSAEEIAHLRKVFVDHFSEIVLNFWSMPEMLKRPRANSYDEVLYRAEVFKRWVEDKDGYKSLNGVHGAATEAEVQRLIFLALQASDFQVDREVNNGRGPVDFKVSDGKRSSALLEVKLASNSGLKRNLEKQVEIYKKANETEHAVKMIIFYTAAEQAKVERALKALGLENDKSTVVVDARNDNKPTGSKA